MSKNLKLYSPTAINKMQIKTMMKYLHTVIRVATVRNTDKYEMLGETQRK